MVRKLLRPRTALVLAVGLLAALLGCTSSGDRFGPLRRLTNRPERTTEELKASVGWLDPDAQEAGRSTLRAEHVHAFAANARAAAKPPVPYPRKSVLVVSGGGAYGAYPAGVLVGWTAT